MTSRQTPTAFDLLERRVGHLFEDFLEDYGWGRSSLFHKGTAGTSPDYPYFEVSETDEEYRVKAELPGMDEKDIEVSIEGCELTVRGERKREAETKHRDYYVSEVCYGEFCRSIELPQGVDREKVRAQFRKGELVLTLPKTAEGRALKRRIDVIAA